MDDALRETLLEAEAADAPDAVIGPDVFLRLVRALRTLDTRIDELETQANRAALVDALPENAPLGALIRLRGDLSGALYLGNGPTRPLTKVLPQPL